MDDPATHVLAVGDKPFRAKCMRKMMEIRDSGRTLVYVSHSPASVEKMCSRVIVLEKGRLGFDGDPRGALGGDVADRHRRHLRLPADPP